MGRKAGHRRIRDCLLDLLDNDLLLLVLIVLLVVVLFLILI